MVKSTGIYKGGLNCELTHGPSGRRLRYSEVAADAAKVTLDKEPEIKTPDKFTFIGKPIPRVDVAPKIDGSGKYGMDAQVPGMVFAAILQCPVPGGKLKNVDVSAVASRHRQRAERVAPT